MSEEYVKATPVSRAHQDQSQRTLDIEHSGQELAAITTAESPTFAGSLLRSLSVLGRANAPMRQTAMRSMQRIHGNRAVQRTVQRTPVAVQRAGPDEESWWPRWLSFLPGNLRTLVNHTGNMPSPANPAPVYGPLPPPAPTFTNEPPVSGPIPPADMAPPAWPARGELGHVAPHSVPTYLKDAEGNYVRNGRKRVVTQQEQPEAEWVTDAQGKQIRTTEDEHIIPRGNIKQVTMNPNTGVPDYQDSHYTRDTTVRFDRETALNKTYAKRGGPTADNARTDALKARVSNQQPIDYRTDVFEASIENAKRARDATNATAITDGAIHRAALSQDGNLFGMQDLGESRDIVKSMGSNVEDFDIVEYNGPSAGPEVPPAAVETGSTWRNAFRPGGAVDTTMRAASYGSQFASNLAKGQGLGEATTSAVAGGYANNAIGSKMSPKGGLVDTGINLVNSGLQLAGAPEEVTTVTQTVADATPTSFGTSVASNAGRALYSLATGDLEGLKQQGKDIVSGKEGVPLQGYANMVELAANWGDRDYYAQATDEMRAGKRGKFQQQVLQAKDWVADDAIPTVGNAVRDRVGDDITGTVGDLMGLNTSSHIEAEQQQKATAARETLLERNRDQIIEKYGKGTLTMMYRGQIPIFSDVQEMEQKRSASASQKNIEQMEKLWGKEHAARYAAAMGSMGAL